MLQQFLRLICAREALWANHPSSGYYLVTETYTTDIPAPDRPQGLDGGETLRISDNNPGGQNMTLPRPKLLSPKYRTRIGTWNVRTMFQTGKVHQVAREMKRLGLAILGVSETRRTGTGNVQLKQSSTLAWQATMHHTRGGNLPQTSPGSPSSGTLKGPGRGADPKNHGEGQYRRSSRTLGCRGRR